MENENRKEFSVARWDPDAEYVIRSFSLRKDLDDRMKNLEKDYQMYTKKSIFNELIAKALTDYGY